MVADAQGRRRVDLGVDSLARPRLILRDEEGGEALEGDVDERGTPRLRVGAREVVPDEAG